MSVFEIYKKYCRIDETLDAQINKRNQTQQLKLLHTTFKVSFITIFFDHANSNFHVFETMFQKR